MYSWYVLVSNTLNKAVDESMAGIGVSSSFIHAKSSMMVAMSTILSLLHAVIRLWTVNAPGSGSTNVTAILYQSMSPSDVKKSCHEHSVGG